MSFDVLEWVDANLTLARPSAGHEWTAECPFCEVFGGFYVNTDPEKRGPYVCFKCDSRAPNCLPMIAHVEDISIHEARAMVFKAGIELRRKETASTLLDRIRGIRGVDLDSIDLEADDNTNIDLPAEFIPVWDGKRWRVPKYLVNRAFKRQALQDCGVGYCQRGWWAGRAIIPLRCPNGHSFTGRDMTGESDDDPSIPKYRNPKGIDHAQLLFGWDRCPERGDFALVEGPLDYVKMYQHGVPSMALGGKVLSVSQLGMLCKRPADVGVTVLLDPEARLDAFRVAFQLIVHFHRVYVAQLPEGIDPGKSTRRQAHRAVDRAEPFSGSRVPGVIETIKASKSKIHKLYGN